MHKVSLKACHIIIEAELAKTYLHNDNFALVSYKAEESTLIVSPTKNDWLKSIHKASPFMLKHKDLSGTRSIAVHELLIDHELEDHDRSLNFETDDVLEFLKIKI